MDSRKPAPSLGLVSLAVGLFAFALAITQASLGADAQPPIAPPAVRELQELHQRLLPVFAVTGVVYSYADEGTGKLVVGVEDGRLAASVRGRASDLGIPGGIVEVVQTPPIVRMITLRDSVRPLQGGLQINFSNFLCTLGFNVIRNGAAGFVTNSHCTDVAGGTEGTQYYQPLSSTEPAAVGLEAADPAYFALLNGCPLGKRCRFSDSALVSYANGVTGQLGTLARTDAANSGSLTIAGSFQISAEGAAGVGAVVNKVGRTTGWTQAPVTASCANVAVSGTPNVLLCQTIVTSSTQIVAGGDSGSAVFGGTGSNVTLYGILWGGTTDGRTFIYSPISNIEAELGLLTTFAGGGTPTPTPTLALTATATFTPAPTATPTPTSVSSLCQSFPHLCRGSTPTPTPPGSTATPTPTATPAPTSTPSPTATPGGAATPTPTPRWCNSFPWLC